MPRKSPDDLPPLTDAARGERLQRVLADAGVASRRDCEALIEGGGVEVNGEVITRLPVWVDPAVDHIVVDGRPLPRAQPRLLYILLNKPARTLTAAEDEPGSDRRTVVELVQHPAAPRLFPVGRLDYDSVGLLLLTNDGELANRLTHPRYGVPKTYKVKVRGQIDDEACRELERGIYLADRKEGATAGASRTAQVELAVLRRERDSTWLELTLREGRNRQVRRMLAAVGFPVLSLERVGMGPLALKGVARGSWRELTAPEVHQLKRAAAMSLSDEDAAARAKARPPAPPRAPGTPRAAGSKRPASNARPAARPPAPGRGRPGTTPTAPAEPPAGPSVRRRVMKNAIRGNPGSARQARPSAPGVSQPGTPKPASRTPDGSGTGGPMPRTTRPAKATPAERKTTKPRTDKTQSLTTKSHKTPSPKSGPSKTGPTKFGRSKPGSSQPRSASSRSAKSGPPKSGPSKSGPSKSGRSKPGPSKPGPSRPGPSKPSGRTPPRRGR